MDTLRVRDLRALTLLIGLLAAVVIPGSDSWSGPVLLTLSATHGVHLADLGVLGLALAVAAWAITMNLRRPLPRHFGPTPA